MKLSETLDPLKSITSECRLDMHEPDEQGIKARVVGDRLDNAMGEGINAKALEGGYQEFVVILDNENTGKSLKINLADLIALARLAKGVVIRGGTLGLYSW